MTSPDEFAAMSDKDLEIAIKRQESSIGIMSSRLPNKGEKFKTRLKTLEDERERRRLRSLDKDVEEREKPTQSPSSDKEDESGPIILHLDSLKLHSSKSVFNNIKRRDGKSLSKILSFLREEWEYMKDGVTSSDLPIADRIWKSLPRRIDEQRFIEEASERLKKKDLQMFGKRWFRPEEASSLRGKIRNLLIDKFQNASEDDCFLESPPSSPGASLL